MTNLIRVRISVVHYNTGKNTKIQKLPNSNITNLTCVERVYNEDNAIKT